LSYKVLYSLRFKCVCVILFTVSGVMLVLCMDICYVPNEDSALYYWRT